MTDPLDILRHDGITHITLNRPDKGNALAPDLVEALLMAVTQAGSDGTRLLVLQGAGRHFCTGFDLGDLDALSDGALCLRVIRIETLLQTVRYAPIPTLALAHGQVIGAGADLFCCCGTRIADPAARFRMPGLGFGMVLGTARFAERVGAETARAILGETRTIQADEAVRIGFASASLAPAGWPAEIGRAATAAKVLDPVAGRLLLDATDGDPAGVRRDRDMAALARSASRPGLKQRVQRYRDTQRVFRDP